MDIRPALKSQYHGALKTLREAIEKCPDRLWLDASGGCAPFWRVAYHTLFYTHFYLEQTQDDFTPWSRHRDEANFLSNLPWENNRPPRPSDPYTREDVLEYWHVCDAMIDPRVDALDLSAPESGFPWYTIPKLEHQIVNIRHIQHHAAALSVRLRQAAGIDIDWVDGA
jgi:DinB superfamily